VKYQPERVVRELAATHMTARELAAMCYVAENTIRKFCRHGRVASVRHGRSWLIPRLDGQLFAAAYLQHHGETWAPNVERAERAWRPTNPTKPTTIQLEVPPEMLRAIDAERERRYRDTGRKRGNMRANIICEAVERWLVAS
jgi:hypothetical protein